MYAIAIGPGEKYWFILHKTIYITKITIWEAISDFISLFIFFQTPFKEIIWEIYVWVSEVLSHLGRMFGMIFRVQWGQKSPKNGNMCLTKMYPCPCKGAAPYMLLLPAAPLQAPCGTLTRTRRHPCKDPGAFWSNTFFHFSAIFDSSSRRGCRQAPQPHGRVQQCWLQWGRGIESRFHFATTRLSI